MQNRPAVLVIVHDIDDNLNELATPLALAGVQLDTWDVQNDQANQPALDDLARYDGIISLGAHAGVLEEAEHEWMRHERKIMQWALDTETPLLGLCFGSQLLASTAGGTIYKAEQGEFGWVEVNMLPAAADDPVLGVLDPTTHGFQFHFDTFDLPEHAVLMGEGNGMNQAFRIGSKAWATQFHPEVGLSQQLTWLSTYRRAFVAEGIDIDEQINQSHDLAVQYRDQAWKLATAFAEQVLAHHGSAATR